MSSQNVELTSFKQKYFFFQNLDKNLIFLEKKGILDKKVARFFVFFVFPMPASICKKKYFFFDNLDINLNFLEKKGILKMTDIHCKRPKKTFFSCFFSPKRSFQCKFELYFKKIYWKNLIENSIAIKIFKSSEQFFLLKESVFGIW